MYCILKDESGQLEVDYEHEGKRLAKGFKKAWEGVRIMASRFSDLLSLTCWTKADWLVLQLGY